jgi:hypothetical protein
MLINKHYFSVVQWYVCGMNRPTSYTGVRAMYTTRGEWLVVAQEVTDALTQRPGLLWVLAPTVAAAFECRVLPMNFWAVDFTIDLLSCYSRS